MMNFLLLFIITSIKSVKITSVKIKFVNLIEIFM